MRVLSLPFVFAFYSLKSIMACLRALSLCYANIQTRAFITTPRSDLCLEPESTPSTATISDHEDLEHHNYQCPVQEMQRQRLLSALATPDDGKDIEDRGT